MNDLERAKALLMYALHLRMYGEHAEGGAETWQQFDRQCEKFLRGEPYTDVHEGLHRYEDPITVRDPSGTPIARVGAWTDPPGSTVVWEACVRCDLEYRAGHLCEEHLLCGKCHADIDETGQEG